LDIVSCRLERLPRAAENVTLHAVVRPPRSIAAAALVGILCATRAASAQDLQYRGTVNAGIQATDNIQFAPMNPVTGANGPTPGFIGEVTPALILSYETPRWLHELQYTFNFAAVFGVGQQINYTNRLELRSRHDVSPITEATFAVRATQGQQTFFPEPQPGQAARVVLPGTFTFVTAEVAQGINRRLSEDAALTEASTVNVFLPVNPEPPRPVVFGANVQLAAQYNDDPDNYALNLGSQLAITGEIECTLDAQCGAGRVCAVATRRCVIPDSTTAVRRSELEAQINAPQLATRLGGNYRHDFKNGFFSDLDLGVQQVMRLTDGGGQIWQPVGRIGIRYEREEATIALNLNHGTVLDPQVGGLVLADNVDLNGTIPIDRETRYFVLQLQMGYQRGTSLNPFGALLPGFQVFAGDAGLTYRPQRWIPGLQVALRYQFRYQITEPAADGTREEVELHAMRNAVMLNFGFEFLEKR